MFTFVAPLRNSPNFHRALKWEKFSLPFSIEAYIHIACGFYHPYYFQHCHLFRSYAISIRNMIIFQKFATKEVLMNPKACVAEKWGRKIPPNKMTAFKRNKEIEKKSVTKVILTQNECHHVFILILSQTTEVRVQKRNEK